MMQRRARWIAISALIQCLWALAPAEAQVMNAVFRIDSTPAGGPIIVDGVYYAGSATVIWPAYSQHTLSVPGGMQNLGQSNTQALFSNWEWAAGTSTSSQSTLVITADPLITEYTAVYTVAYQLNIDCNNITGSVSVVGATIGCGKNYLASGSVLTITAVPAAGYIFTGWVSGQNQSIQGTTDVVTLNGPTQVTPIFQTAAQMNLVTVPAGLHLLVDQANVTTPYQAQWGNGTVHSVGPVSPQMDASGNWWTFSSWSDGLAANHTVTMPNSSMPATLTATFIPAVTVSFVTAPGGLSLTIDGRSNWTSYTFLWGVGETHTISAPVRQADAQGNMWAFSSWSDNGAASHSITVPQSAVPSGMKFAATYTPLGQLTVTSAMAGLTVTVNGTACPTPCTEVLAPGTQVDVSAPLSLAVSALSREDLLGWSTGAGPGDLVLTMGSGSMTVSANYHLLNYLATSSTPAGGVSWSIVPASPDGYYDSQTTIAVTVTPLAGYKFIAWSGDLSGSSPSGTLAMNVPRSIQAILGKVPYLSPNGVINGAGGSAGGGVAPGSVISIFGANLASGIAIAPSGQLPQTLGGLTVTVAGRLLPLFFVSVSQINAQLPADFTPGTQTITVSGTGQPDVETGFTIVQDAPGLYQQTVNGQAMAIALHADGSAVTTDKPAQPGETITVYGTGFGPTTPARPEGLPVASTPPVVMKDAATVQLGGATFAMLNGFAVPGMVGVDAVQFVVGTGAANGQLSLTINGQQSNTVQLPVQSQ
jgi:uncharacterized protein (TIGR03437 family)